MGRRKDTSHAAIQLDPIEPMDDLPLLRFRASTSVVRTKEKILCEGPDLQQPRNKNYCYLTTSVSCRFRVRLHADGSLRVREL
jgi:hypothetical protein